MTADIKLKVNSLAWPCIALLCSIAVLVIAPCTAQAQAPIARDCLALAAGLLDRDSQAAYDKGLKTWLETCQQALAAIPTTRTSKSPCRTQCG